MRESRAFVTCAIAVVMFAPAGCGLEETRRNREILQHEEENRLTREFEPWIGRLVSDYILQHGAATNSSEDGKGGKVYTWAKSSSGLAHVGYGLILPVDALASSSSFSLFADPSGKIYHWMKRDGNDLIARKSGLTPSSAAAVETPPVGTKEGTRTK
jgi:hypothetical protein